MLRVTRAGNAWGTRNAYTTNLSPLRLRLIERRRFRLEETRWGVQCLKDKFGLLVVSLPVALFFDILMLTKPLARTDKSLSPITLIVFIGMGFMIFFIKFQDFLGPLQHGININKFLIFLFFF